MRGVFGPDSGYRSLPEGERKSQQNLQLFTQVGLTERFEVDLQTVFTRNQRTTSAASAESSGIGDSYLFLRWLAFAEGPRSPCLTLMFQAKAPTGKYQSADPAKLGTDLRGAPTGGGPYEHSYGLNLTKRVKPFQLHADTLLALPIETTLDGVRTDYGDYFLYDFGVEWFLPKGLNILAEFNGTSQRDRADDGARIDDSGLKSFTLSTGVGWSGKRFQTLLAYQRTLLGKNVDAVDGLALGLQVSY
jgi:hypothetical protein